MNHCKLFTTTAGLAYWSRLMSSSSPRDKILYNCNFSTQSGNVGLCLRSAQTVAGGIYFLLIHGEINDNS